jgi:hypothetical protein
MIITITKFRTGAWIVISAMPVFILLMLLVERHYRTVEHQLRRGTVRIGEVGANKVVLVLTDIDAAATEALGYIRSFRPDEAHAVYVGSRPREEARVLWDGVARGGPALSFPEGAGSVDAVLRFVRAIPRAHNDFVSVVIPELFRKRSLLQAIRRPVTFRLKVRLLREPGVVVTDVPVVLQDGQLDDDARPLIPERIVALVFVSSAHDATVRAMNYARSLRAAETRAVSVALDEEEVPDLMRRWADLGIGIPLDVVEAPFRDLGPPVLEEVRRVTQDPKAVAAVIIPEFVVRRWWHPILHNNRALFMKRLLLFEPRVILSSVPFPLE